MWLSPYSTSYKNVVWIPCSTKKTLLPFLYDRFEHHILVTNSHLHHSADSVWKSGKLSIGFWFSVCCCNYIKLVCIWALMSQVCNGNDLSNCEAHLPKNVGVVF